VPSLLQDALFLFIADPRFEHGPVALDGSAEDIDASCSRPLIRGAHMRLKDKVAIVTGGAHGMGEAEARLVAAEGAKVIVADILENGAARVATDIRASGGEAMAARIDVTSESEWMDLIAKALAAYGRRLYRTITAASGPMICVGYPVALPL
jgi:short chain dehydrogenase